MRQVAMSCHYCGTTNELPANRPASFYRCHACRALNALTLAERLAFMRKSEAPLPVTIARNAPRRA